MKRSNLLLSTLFLFNAVSVFANESGPSDNNWSQWRGSEGTGVSTETNVPMEWSSGKNLKWKAPLPGSGHSSPIVWGNKVFLTAEIEGEVVVGAQAVKHVIFRHRRIVLL